MWNLFSHWAGVAQRLRAKPHTLFLFDYDGVLAPIAPTPGQARLKSPVRHLLRRLSEQPGNQVGVISGRSLSDVRRMVRLPRLIYGGNHGLEISGRNIQRRHRIDAKRRSVIRRLASVLIQQLRSIPGAFVEYKGMTLSLHRRLVRPGQRADFHRMWWSIVSPIVRRNGLEIRYGKEVVEIRPKVKWDKGSALKLLKKQMPRQTAVFYAGDDRTDEDAFRALEATDVGVRVGRSGRSAAQYRVRSPHDIELLLKKLVLL